MFSIESASVKDWREIADLHTLSWQTTYVGMLDDDYLQNRVLNERQTLWEMRLGQPDDSLGVFVAREHGRLIGFVCVRAHQHAEFGHLIDNLHVATAYQGKGMGVALLAKGMEWLSQISTATPVYLEVLCANHSAVGFYQRLGGACLSSGHWQAPSGQSVPEYIYGWSNSGEFAEYLAAVNRNHSKSISIK